jgi:protoporphyrinogen oxidase
MGLQPVISKTLAAWSAGLTVALEFLKKGDIHPIVVEQENFVGGISSTYELRF